MRTSHVFRPIVPLLAVFLAIGPLRDAVANPCDASTDGMPTGPVGAALLDGDLGRAHRFCGRSDVGLDAGGLLLADTPNFYGHLSAVGTLEASAALGRRAEVFARVEFLRHESVITPIPASATGLGFTTLGGAGQILVRDRWGLGLVGDLVLPTTVGIYAHAWPVGADLGMTGQFAPTRGVQFHAQAGLLGSAALSAGASQPRLGCALTAGTELRPGRVFAAAVDLYGNFGYRGPLDTLAVSPGLRFGDGRRFGFELAGIVPFAGVERAAAAVDLRASIRWGS